jgi:serine/threonine-protein kinase
MDEPRPAEPAIPASTLSIGDVVSDRYRIDAVLGEGGMGVVYRAEHLHLHKPFALKVLLPEWSSTPEVVARFEREAVAAGNIQSPHVATATDFGRLPDGSFFLVMEYAGGRTLRSVLEAGALEPLRALRVLEGIAAGLGAAHALGFVHRDLKPENVMLVERDGDPDFAKILDFGIAKVDAHAAGGVASSQPLLTQAGAIIGTPDYMSPEQSLGQPIDARSDLYSAGVILFEMLTGQCPFGGGAVTVLRQHVMGEVPELPPDALARVDPRVAALLRSLLAKVPDNRAADAAELLVAIRECMQAQTPAAVVVRVSLDSTDAMTTSLARRVRHSLLAGMKAVERVGRQAMADPRAILHRVGERRAIAIVAVTIVAAIVLLELVSRTGAQEPSTAVPLTPAPTVTSASTSASTATAVGADVPPFALPPPPAPSASTAATAAAGAAKSGQGRHTGPGGIYIPPPSTWFK